MSRVLRAFYILHTFQDKVAQTPKKCSEDFPPETCFLDAKKYLQDKFGYPPQHQHENAHDFAEVTHHTITDTEHELGKIESPLHLGTDCIFPPAVYAELEDPTKIKRRKKSKKIV